MSSQPIFGANLEEAIRISHIPDTPMVPAVLHRCAQFLEAKGVDEVGLYRVPGSHANVQKLKRMFDSGKDYNLLTMDAIDANDIATLLKLYLREYRHICHTLRGILIRLPRPNYVVLSYLCHHLSKIASHSDKTKMTVSNLGVVFAPTLSIGSVLFKALLGGFYDGADTPENMEKGLKIVWGGLLQDMDYDWSDEDKDSSQQDESRFSNGGKAEYQDPSGLSQQQPPHWIRHQQSLPTMSPLNGQYTNGHQAYLPVTHQGIGPLDLSPPHSIGTSSRHTTNDSDEESRLMQEMLLKEELAANESVEISHSPGQIDSTPTSAIDNNTLPPSHTTSTAKAVPDHLTSSTPSSTDLDVHQNSSPMVAMPITSFTKPLPLHITTSTGNMSNTLPPRSAGKATSPGSPLSDPSVLRSATGAPQLPLFDSIPAL
ncbi:hypothetical protein BGZ97_013248 [Linnemannia gamsii]|uniref:Rho-GAP domain-containing protein n=1 Tax=Linnemannia gamsii TaxID=64522 RepID=A0A9P6R215_9FUNG|nr:hypothetical protein BGZ97_013248 [Linnemannia gamsii]